MPEIRVDKQFVNNKAVTEQGAVGIYFEYTYAKCALDPFTGGEIALDNLSFFAVGNMLFVRRSVGEVAVPTSTPASLIGTSVQVQFKDDSKSGLGRPLTEAEAFLTVIRAWEFATQRPQPSHTEVSTGSGSMAISLLTHQLVSEPLLVPVGEKDLELVRKGDTAVGRRLLNVAQAFWLETSVHTPYDDGTPAHRLSKTRVELDTDTLMGKITMALLTSATDFPEYPQLTSTVTDALDPLLVKTAQAEHSWA